MLAVVEWTFFCHGIGSEPHLYAKLADRPGLSSILWNPSVGCASPAEANEASDAMPAGAQAFEGYEVETARAHMTACAPHEENMQHYGSGFANSFSC